MRIWNNKEGMNFTYKWRSVSDMQRAIGLLQVLERGAENDENNSAMMQIQDAESQCLVVLGNSKLKGK